jgi:O-methyltransferase
MQFFNRSVEINFFNLVKNTCNPISMIRDHRFAANILAVEHVLENNLDGDIVEVGVWKGGSVVSMLMTLIKNNNTSKKIHLYDTFEGMTPHTEKDFDLQGRAAGHLINSNPFWLCISPLEEVKNNISKTGYPEDLISYHKGDICKANFIPNKISFLRLDTDWYESTKCELEKFYDNVVSGGIIMLDDYGHWQGCKKAVDEFLLDKPNIKIIKIDYTGVYFIKP